MLRLALKARVGAESVILQSHSGCLSNNLYREHHKSGCDRRGRQHLKAVNITKPSAAKLMRTNTWRFITVTLHHEAVDWSCVHIHTRTQHAAHKCPLNPFYWMLYMLFSHWLMFHFTQKVMKHKLPLFGVRTTSWGKNWLMMEDEEAVRKRAQHCLIKEQH